MNREEEIKRMLANSFTYKQIGDFYGVTRQAIQDYCKKRGIEKPPKVVLPKVKSELQLLKESGTPWCNHCHAQNDTVTTNGKKGHLCRKCNSERMNKYYHTRGGRVSIVKSKIKYEARKKAEKALLHKA